MDLDGSVISTACATSPTILSPGVEIILEVFRRFLTFFWAGALDKLVTPLLYYGDKTYLNKQLFQHVLSWADDRYRWHLVQPED